MLRIRPAWQAKGLIDRVRRLLPVDPSSACQRLLNAAIQDLREKINIAGLDIAKEAAASHGLPPVNRAEDVDNYSTAKIIELSYRIGLLTRPEWRRLGRAYDIRKDLEHEDSEYEATLEDCVYIFNTCIEAVLSKDPVTLIKVTEVKDIIQTGALVTADGRLVEDFRHAPDTRQLEILKLLVSGALNLAELDIVRQNAYNVLGTLSMHSRDAVKVELAKHLQNKLGRNLLTDADVRVAQQAGILIYLRKAQRRDFFAAYLAGLEATTYSWRNNAEHGEPLRQLGEYGGLASVPETQLPGIIKWMALCFVGEPGGYGAGVGRPVFYSNSAAPLIVDLIKESAPVAKPLLEALATDVDFKKVLGRGAAVSRRFDLLLDAVE